MYKKQQLDIQEIYLTENIYIHVYKQTKYCL